VNETERQHIMEAASILRMMSRNYHDRWKRNMDAQNGFKANEAIKAYEKFSELNKIANELDIIAQDNL
jgi:hypothetical protein